MCAREDALKRFDRMAGVMKLLDPKESTVVQTHEPPMTDLDAVRDHAAAVGVLVSWNSVGVLIDDGPQAIVTVLLEGEEVVSALRFCLPPVQSVQALRAYGQGTTGSMELRCWQGHTIASEQTQNLTDLTHAWKESSSQRTAQADEHWIVSRQVV